MPTFTLVNVIFGLLEGKYINLINHIILIYKLFLYKFQDATTTDLFKVFVTKINEIPTIEYRIAFQNSNTLKHLKKWEVIFPLLDLTHNGAF